MSDTHLELGTDVITSDGLTFGKLHQIVADSRNHALPAIIVRYGRLPDHRDFIVGWKLIDHVEDTGIVLKIDGKQVEKLPEMIKVASVSASNSPGMPYVGPYGTAEAMAHSDFIGDAVRADTPVVGEAGAVPLGSSTAFDMTSMNIELETNLPEDSVVVSSDTEVLTSDEKKIGKLHDVLCDENAVVTGFVGRAGHLRHHTFYVPAKFIAGTSHRHVRLNITADDVAHLSSDQENG